MTTTRMFKIFEDEGLKYLAASKGFWYDGDGKLLKIDDMANSYLERNYTMLNDRRHGLFWCVSF